MQIGSVVFKPYIYNTNYVSGNSLGKVSAISDDVLSAQTDYTDLVADDVCENLLRRGETSNFADVMAMQFQMSRLNATRLIKPVEEMENMQQQNSYMMKKAAQAYDAWMIG